jgi:hypothetical protein
MEKEFNSIRSVLGKYEKYILEKRKQQHEIRMKEESRHPSKNNINLLFIPGEEEEEQNKPIQYTKGINFKTLKEYIDVKVNDKRSLFSNRMVHDILSAREYDKKDLNHMVSVIDLIRNDITNYIDNENRRKIEEFEMHQRRIEDEKNKINAIVPRFSCGMQFHTKEWNEFVYRDNSIIHDIILHHSSFGSMFIGVFMSLIKDINDEESLVNIANAVNCPIDRKLLSDLPQYRMFTHHIGFFFSNPMMEKEFNDHVANTCHLLWWMYYAPQKSIDTQFVNENTSIAYNQMIEHYTTHFSPLWKREIRNHSQSVAKLNVFFDSCILFDRLQPFNFNENKNTIVKVFIDHDPESIEEFKQRISVFIVEINNCFSNLFTQKTRKEKELQKKDIISLASIDHPQQETEISDFFDGEKLLDWFCDTKITNELLFSRFSTIYVYNDEEFKNIMHKCIIAHKSADYVDYKRYGLLKDYINETSIGRIIPSDHREKLPMLNLSGYLTSFFGAVMVNPYAFENVEQEHPQIYENLFFIMVFVIERFQLDTIQWFTSIDDVNSVDHILPWVEDHVFYRKESESPCEKIIVDEIFNVCKRCLFSTAKGIIDYFMCIENEITLAIQSHFDSIIKKTKTRSIVKHPVINEFIAIRKVRQNGEMCIQFIIQFILFQTYQSSTARFLVALKTIQNMYYTIVSKSKPSSSNQDVEFRAKLELEMTRRLTLVLKNKKYQESIWHDDEGNPFLNSILNLSHFGQRDALNDFKSSTSKVVLVPFINHLIHVFFVFMKEKVSDVDQNAILEYVVKYITKIFSLMNDLKTMKSSWFLKCMVKHGVESNTIYVDFIDNICKYYKSLAAPDNRRVIGYIYTHLESLFKQKISTNLGTISKFHELFRTMIILRLFYVFDEDDEMVRIIHRLIDDKKDAIISIQQKEMQKQIVNVSIGSIKDVEREPQLSDVSSIFEKKSTQDMAEYFDTINFFLQSISLLSHHFNWQNVSESAVSIMLQKAYQNDSFRIGIHSYHDLNEESSSIVRINRAIHWEHVEESIFMLISFERLIIEKTERKGQVFSSLSQMFAAAERCKNNLKEIGITSPEECISHTPESKMIGWMMTFIKHKMLRTYDRALRESRYPEDGFIIILTEEKMASIELIQSIFNYIISVYSRVKIASSVAMHMHIKQKDQAVSDDFMLNPLKYFIKDALLNHPFHVRMLQLYIKSRSTILSRAWLILPYKVARERIGTGSDREKTIAYLEENSVDVDLFDKHKNPKHYLMWRFWFMNLPFVDNTILLKQHKPARGCAYFLTDEPPTMPSGHSDSSVLNLSNIMTNSACSSSSSSQ